MWTDLLELSNFHWQEDGITENQVNDTLTLIADSFLYLLCLHVFVGSHLYEQHNFGPTSIAPRLHPVGFWSPQSCLYPGTPIV